ncbi:MAG: homocitrate synthase [Halanaerobium sp.]
MKRIKIVDTTLRDGEQTPGVVFSQLEKIEIVTKLARLKVEVIEVGIAAVSKEERTSIKSLLALNLPPEMLLWNRIKLSDIDYSLECGAQYLHLSAPVSRLHIKEKLNKSYEIVLREMQQAVKYAKTAGVFVSVGAEDASRADFSFLKEYIRAAEEVGADRLRYADTVGILDPTRSYDRLRAVKDFTTLEIEFHAHNDFGLAVANSLAAAEAGADYISCTIDGLGERAGNTDHKKFIKAYNYFYGSEPEAEKK